MTMALFILILIFSLALYYLFSPLFSARASSMVFDDQGLDIGDLLQKKQGVLDDMRELEWDRQVMKLEKSTFDELYEQGLQEGALLLGKIADAQKSAMPSGRVAKRFCTQCGHALAKSDKFCSQCGVQS